MEAAQRSAGPTPTVRPPAPSGRSPQGGLVIIIAGTHEERLRLARALPASATALLVADSQQAGRVLAQFSQASGDPALASGMPSPSQPPSQPRAQTAPVADLQVQRQHRAQSQPSQCQLRLRADRLSLSFGPREVSLTKLELDLLAYLLPRAGETVTFEQLSHVAWHTNYLGNGAHMHAAVGRLRTKLADLGAPVSLQAVRGLGFRLVSHIWESPLREVVGS